MGLFDNTIAQDIQAVAAAPQTITDFISNAPSTDLVQVGVAQLGNVTPAQIAAGVTGAAAQAAPVPSKVPPVSTANAATIKATATTGGSTLLMIAAGWYFLRKYI